MAVGPWLDSYFDLGLGLGIGPSNLLVDKRLVRLDKIEDSFQLHGCGTPEDGAFATTSITENLAAVYFLTFAFCLGILPIAW